MKRNWEGDSEEDPNRPSLGHLPKIYAFNFVLTRSLGGGERASLRFDRAAAPGLDPITAEASERGRGPGQWAEMPAARGPGVSARKREFGITGFICRSGE